MPTEVENTDEFVDKMIAFIQRGSPEKQRRVIAMLLAHHVMGQARNTREATEVVEDIIERVANFLLMGLEKHDTTPRH